MKKKKSYADYKNGFNKKTYKRYGLMVKMTDTKIIEKLDSVASKNAYIIALIKKDLEN